MTTRLYDSGFGCVIISHTIMNRAIRRYPITFILSNFNTIVNKLFIILQHVAPYVTTRCGLTL
jgi:hypothetical protein